MQKLTEYEAEQIRKMQECDFKSALENHCGRWRNCFDDRQKRLIENCQIYAQNDPAGMPGHNLAIIISKLADLLDGDGAKSRRLWET